MISNSRHYEDAPEIYHPFLALVTTDQLAVALEDSREETLRLFYSLPAAVADHAYAPGKWTVKEVLRHIIDCERIYAYRALRLSRFDAAPIIGFDENAYAEAVRPVCAGMDVLLEEYRHVRAAGVCLFRNMNNAMLDFKGTVNGLAMTARVLGFLTAGHNLHHCNVIRDKYL